MEWKNDGASSNAKYAGTQSQFDSQPVVLQSITVIGMEPSNPANAVAKVSAAPAKLAAKAASAPEMSKADMDRIEREAREVIHGDYGNNPSRAQKLGADYELVQARVNQILHS